MFNTEIDPKVTVLCESTAGARLALYLAHHPQLQKVIPGDGAVLTSGVPFLAMTHVFEFKRAGESFILEKVTYSFLRTRYTFTYLKFSCDSPVALYEMLAAFGFVRMSAEKVIEQIHYYEHMARSDLSFRYRKYTASDRLALP